MFKPKFYTKTNSALSFVEACAELDSVFFVRAKKTKSKIHEFLK